MFGRQLTHEPVGACENPLFFFSPQDRRPRLSKCKNQPDIFDFGDGGNYQKGFEPPLLLVLIFVFVITSVGNF